VRQLEIKVLTDTDGFYRLRILSGRFLGSSIV